MDISKISASSYKLHSHCQMAYFISNLLKWQFRPGKAADLGTICHAVLEALALIKLGKQDNLVSVTTEQGLVINTSQYNIENIVEETYAYFTNLKEYQNQKWEVKDLKDIKKYVLIVLNHNNGQFNPLNKEIISTEQRIDFQIKEPWALLPDQTYLRITGFVDLVTRISIDTIEITDYKTGSLTDFHSGATIDIEYAMKDIQLRLYHMALAEKFGCDNNYLLTLFYLKHAKPITVSFDCNTIEETRAMLKLKFLEIVNTGIPKRNRSWKCKKFCEFGKNTFDGVQVKPIQQFLDGQITYPGVNMCICDQVHFEINRRGLGWAQENLKYKKPEVKTDE